LIQKTHYFKPKLLPAIIFGFSVNLGETCTLLCPAPNRWGHYAMMLSDICLSVCCIHQA